METTISSLPTEMMLNILSRLCIQDLSPCRFVMKDWYNIIVRDPVFADSHRSRIDLDDPTFILLSDEDNLYLVDNKSMSTEPMAVSIGACLRNREFSLVGSANGLLCLEIQMKAPQVCFILNPITKEIVSLPRPPEIPSGPIGSVTKYPAFGFAYDATTKTYKLVQAWYFDGGHDQIPVMVFDIHTIGSGKWRRCEISDASTYWDQNTVFLNNALHWQIYNRHFGYHVCALDIGAETFTRFENPPPEYDDISDDISYKSLATIKGCLAFFAEIDGELLVWVMKDYGKDESWTKEYTICLNRPRDFEDVIVEYPWKWILRTYGFKTLRTMNNGSTLFCDGEHLSYFDFEKGDKQVIHIHGIPSCNSSEFLDVVAHVGSLVSPKSIVACKETTSDMPSDKHPVGEIQGEQNDWKDNNDTVTYTEFDLDGEDGYEDEDEDEYEYEEENDADGYYLDNDY